MRIVSLSLLLALFIASCQPDLSDELPRREVYASLQEFQVKNKVVPQVFTANSSNNISLQGSKGSRFVFSANAFVTLDGQPVTGNVTIEVKEILKPIDMILSNMPTMSDGKPLESGGQFYIRATQNNQELKLAPGRKVEVKVNVDTVMQGMQVFTGQVTTNGNVNWQVSTSQANVVVRDSVGPASSVAYSMFADRMEWLNIDKFAPESLVSFTANPGNCPDIEETAMFVHLTGRNSVLSLFRQSNQFGSNQMVPGPATIVAICIKEKKIYYAMVPVTIANGGSVTLQFTETTETELKQKLSTL
jgi:outer membrane protein assembly factor BamB